MKKVSPAMIFIPKLSHTGLVEASVVTGFAREYRMRSGNRRGFLLSMPVKLRTTMHYYE